MKRPPTHRLQEHLSDCQAILDKILSIQHKSTKRTYSLKPFKGQVKNGELHIMVLQDLGNSL